MADGPPPGTVVLVDAAGADAPVTGTVRELSPAPGGFRLVVEPDRPSPAGDGCVRGDCEVTAFGDGALWVGRGAVGPSGGATLVIDLDRLERIERRRVSRARLEVPAAVVAFSEGGLGVVTGRTEDLGTGGARIRTTDAVPFEMGRPVWVLLGLPGGDVAVEATVAGTSPVGTGAPTVRVRFRPGADPRVRRAVAAHRRPG